MNKSAIWAIIILMSAAMLGIAAIQMYWINFSIRLDEKKFDERVFMALKRVEERVTKADEESADWPTIGAEAITYSKWKDIQELGKVFEVDTLGRMDLPSYGGYDAWQRKMLFFELKSMQSKFGSRPLQERVEPKALGTIIRQELTNRGIDLSYDYGVYDYENEGFVVINDNYTVQIAGNDKMSSTEVDDQTSLYDTPYKVELFPSELGSPGTLQVYFPYKRRWLWESVWPLILSSILFTGLILFCFAYTVYVIFRQKKVGEMKTDFINNMTHEFKTPIATISLATDSITNPSILGNQDKVRRFADIIRQENKRMLSQVERVLQMALLDKKDFKLKLGEVDLHQVIQQAMSNMLLQVQKRGGQITAQLEAENPVIEGDVTHLSNIVHNLLDNANKYSPETPEILISTKNVPNGIQVRIKDNGIGLSKEAKKQIFDKFYRVHTGNLHDVKGFGLGLSYVKAMMTAHKGTIEVESELGEGSTFILTIPRVQTVTDAT